MRKCSQCQLREVCPEEGEPCDKFEPIYMRQVFKYKVGNSQYKPIKAKHMKSAIRSLKFRYPHQKITVKRVDQNDYHTRTKIWS